MVSNAQLVNELPRMPLRAQLHRFRDRVFRRPTRSRGEVSLQIINHLFLKSRWVCSDHRGEPLHQVRCDEPHDARQADSVCFGPDGSART